MHAKLQQIQLTKVKAGSESLNCVEQINWIRPEVVLDCLLLLAFSVFDLEMLLWSQASNMEGKWKGKKAVC